jgi:hypothetical protein
VRGGRGGVERGAPTGRGGGRWGGWDYLRKSGMSRSSSGSCFLGRLGWVVELELLGPLVGQECWVDGDAGVCGAGWADCWPVWTVRTPSPA